MKYIPGVDYFVYYEKLPHSVHGMVTTNDDCTYTIYINSDLPDAKRLAAYFHEVDHIESEDFYNGIPIELVENL